MSSQSSEPSNSGRSIPNIRGTKPGLLDPSQRGRLLRFNGSLSFASFDPHTAHVVDDVPDIRGLSIDETLPPPKRIVIESTSSGTSFWRFVPRACLDEGVVDEGLWPRVVDICGEPVFCYQEQWEIYKLDPAYKCSVHLAPELSSISRVGPETRPESSTHKTQAPKRTRTPPFEETPLHNEKRARSRQVGLESDDDTDDDNLDEEEVKRMVVDDLLPKDKSKCGNRAQTRENRKNRWQRNKLADARYVDRRGLGDVPSVVMEDASTYLAPGQSTPTQDGAKRRGPDAVSPSEEQSVGLGRARPNKRSRMMSPASVHTAMKQKRAERDRRRRAKAEVIQRSHHDEWERKFMEDIRQFPSEWKQGTSTTTASTPETNEPEAERKPDDDQKSSREAELAESIRKLQELNKDRPLWEAHRRQREARERAEEAERVAKAEARRKAEAAQKKRHDEEAERDRKRAQLEAETRRVEEENRQRQHRQRKQRERWEAGPWTIHRALERYKVLSEDFDNAKFAPDQPLGFHDIPWPVLTPPSRFTVEDVDWSAVEKFFETVRDHMRPQDYKTFVEKSHRRFHPDRWRARKVWSAVRDEVERGYLEVAANTVAQAITPLWREVKGS
ncbi:hypothetical protein BV22DRAFT_1125410 [Leucogyrophana mollusca]|uniref:Uncharacterized protein n=1 Tax=Leucogyrophana mollusca TaxID=85980 RepID=A0ACB8BYE8_9AGAM|nr:hypothetical protein BV22DRAFT_1125410 [Leucogyrophana mollusca]